MSWCSYDLKEKRKQTDYNWQTSTERKTLRNSLKTFSLPTNLKEDTIFGQRPEQLGVSDFVRITNLIAHDAI